jgi:hypothetical protein
MKKGFLLSGFLLAITILAGLLISSTNPVEQKRYNPDQGNLYAAEAYLSTLRANQNTGIVDPVDELMARATANNLKDSRQVNALNWISLGPDNFGGKTTAILWDKADPDANTILAATMGGGVWRSINNGITWSPVSNVSLQASSMIQTSDGTIYVGTGDGKAGFTTNYNGLGILAYTSSFMGTGIYKSTDGTNFNLLPATAPTYNNNTTDWAFVYSMAANGNNHVYAATNTGIKYSSDGGDSWSYAKDIDGAELIQRAISIKIGSDGTILVSVGSSVYRSSTGAPDAFVKISGGDVGQLPEANVFMTELAIAPSNPNIMYALQINSAGTHTGVYRSVDKGETWSVILPATQVINLLQSRGGSNSFITVFPQNPDRILIGGVNLWEGKKVVDEGLFAWDMKSRNFTFQFDPSFLPAGQQTFAFRNGTNNQFMAGTDGGIFKGQVAGDNYTYTTSNRNFITSQFYTVYPSGGENKVIGGAQNNGVIYISGTGNTVREGKELWFQGGSFINGHGTTTAISVINPEAIVMGSVSGQIFRSEDLAFQTSMQFLKDTSYMRTSASVVAASNTFRVPVAMWESFENHNSRDSVTFFARRDYPAGSVIKARSRNNEHPFYYTLPSNQSLAKGDSIRIKDIVSSKLFIAAQNRLWMTNEVIDFAKLPAWYLVSNNTTGLTGMPNAITVSADANHVFVGMLNGRVFRVSGLADAYNFSTAQINGSNYAITTAELPVYHPGTEQQVTQAVTSIAVDPNNANNVVVTYGNYGNQNYVFMSSNALSEQPTFASKQGNLPAMPVYASLFEMSSPQIVMLGTDLGVFMTENINSTTPTWVPDHGVLGQIPVFDLKQQRINKSADTLQLINIDTLVLHYPGTNNLGIIYAATFGKGLYRANDFRKPVGLDEKPYAFDAGSLSIQIYPNPVINRATIEFNLTETANVSYQIFDITGRMIQSQAVGQRFTGSQKLSIESTGLNPGAYIIRVQAGSKTASSKFLVY